MLKIKDFEYYTIDKNGNVFSIRKNKYLKPYLDRKNGYLSVALHKDGTHKNYRVHRLVAETFISNPSNLPQVNHIDGNKLNNNVENLEWCTSQQNIQHAWTNGLNYISEKHRKVASKIQKERWERYRKKVEGDE